MKVIRTRQAAWISSLLLVFAVVWLAQIPTVLGANQLNGVGGDGLCPGCTGVDTLDCSKIGRTGGIVHSCRIDLHANSGYGPCTTGGTACDPPLTDTISCP